MFYYNNTLFLSVYKKVNRVLVSQRSTYLSRKNDCNIYRRQEYSFPRKFGYSVDISLKLSTEELYLRDYIFTVTPEISD